MKPCSPLISKKLFEVGFQYLFTDYVDDVSGNYVDLGILNSDLARVMSYRNNELGQSENSISYRGRDGNTYGLRPVMGLKVLPTSVEIKATMILLVVITVRASRILNAIIHKATSR